VTKVAIIGSGISGTMLALRLQQLGVETTLHAERAPEDMRAGRLPNTVGRWQHSLAREAALASTTGMIDHWDDEASTIRRVHLAAGPPLSVGFVAELESPLRAADFRVLLPPGSTTTPSGAARWWWQGSPPMSRRLTGWPPGTTWRCWRWAGVDPRAVSRRPGPLPLRRAQRLVFAGLFDGLALPEPFRASFNIAPGVGESSRCHWSPTPGLGPTS
jgi:hypothetical protein